MNGINGELQGSDQSRFSFRQVHISILALREVYDNAPVSSFILRTSCRPKA